MYSTSSQSKIIYTAAISNSTSNLTIRKYCRCHKWYWCHVLLACNVCPLRLGNFTPGNHNLIRLDLMDSWLPCCDQALVNKICRVLCNGTCERDIFSANSKLRLSNWYINYRFQLILSEWINIYIYICDNAQSLMVHEHHKVGIIIILKHLWS